MTAAALTREIPYGNDASQFGRLHLPQGAGPHPVLTVVHGGYWKDSKNLDNYPTRVLVPHFAPRVAVWNVEYRRMGLPGGGWPGTFLDVARAIDHLRVIGPGHGLDLERCTVVGHSAGGQLATWIACRPNVPRSSPLFVADPFVPATVFSLGGIPDLEAAWDGGLGNDTILPRLMGQPPADVPDKYAATSPARLVPPACPVTLVHGLCDVDVTPEQSRRFHAVATEAGADCELIELEEADHFTMLQPETPSWDALMAALERRSPYLAR
jgi:acetyl esterase/lipase